MNETPSARPSLAGSPHHDFRAAGRAAPEVTVNRIGPLYRAAVAATALLAVECRSRDGSEPEAAPPTQARVTRESNPAVPGIEPEPALVAKLSSALAAKGARYHPRTRHLLSDGKPRYINRLILESSPYLLQHAHNPVSWYPWGDEAFERARRENKPIFLSVGYSTCHWCHVMERESFEDEEIARYLNENFVAIKVDREERPAVDALYMTALQLMNGSGGWPMTLVLDLDREPFFSATYVPARDADRGASTGLLTLLHRLHDVWVSEPTRVRDAAAEIVARVREVSKPNAPGPMPGPAAIRSGVQALAHTFDGKQGGFGPPPKFPSPVSLDLLERFYRRTRDPRALEMLERTLEAMAAGGINDQVGGGFHRYSTDARWRVPHFEKMLYDNAQLVATYLAAYLITGRQDFADVARRTLDYLDREMSDPAGGFHSATDADSPGPNGHDEEGRFFTWTPGELREVLGAQRARIAASCLGVTENGDLDGRSVLHVPGPPEKIAASLHLKPTALRDACGAVRRDLYSARAERSPPQCDDKVVAAWNGLAISAFARGAQVLGDERYAGRAVRAAEHVLGAMSPNGRLVRSWKDGRPGKAGTLDDYAFVAQGAIDLFEATHDPRWLSSAIALHRTLERHFRDPNGGYLLTADDDEALLTREKPGYDGAEPAGNSVAALNLLRLAELTGEDSMRKAGEATIRAFASQLDGRVLPAMLAALDFATDRPLEVVVVAPPGGDAAPMIDAARRIYVPNRVLVVATEGPDLVAQERLVPLIEGKRAMGGKPTAYVCRRSVCDLPTSEPKVFVTQLSRVDPLPQ
jgi:uncharacterized protein YyaL (SSP411 family)